MKLKQYIFSYFGSLSFGEGWGVKKIWGVKKPKYFILLLLCSFGFAQPTCSDNPTNYSSNPNFTVPNTGVHNITNDINYITASNTINNAAYFANDIVLSSGFKATAGEVLLSIENCVTGTYDLMIKDGLTDVGNEPNNETQHMWTSPDIWNTLTENDNSEVHQNPVYNSNGFTNYLKVKVKNKGNIASSSNAQVKLYWAKASAGLTTTTPWNGTVFFNGNPNTPMGGIVGTMPIQTLQPNQETTITFPWNIINPLLYNNVDQWHYCLLAEIIDPIDEISTGTNDINIYTRNSNNVAWKNVTVINTSPLTKAPPTGVVAIGNPLPVVKNFYLEFLAEELETGKPIFIEAEVTIQMDDILYGAWVKGNKETTHLISKKEDKIKVIKGNHALLKNLIFNPNEFGHIRINFNFLTEELTSKTNFVYHLIQKETGTNKIIGGETFYIEKNLRNPFDANADDKEIDKYDDLTINAQDIGEAAIYNWYDSEGNLIFEGKDLFIANAVADKYKLEVISLDGFKNYKDVQVKLKPNRLETLYPNPANTGNLNIRYKINEANSAYLMITSYYMNGGISNNYIIDKNATEKNIDLGLYPNGFYKVALITDGKIVDVKILSKL